MSTTDTYRARPSLEPRLTSASSGTAVKRCLPVRFGLRAKPGVHAQRGGCRKTGFSDFYVMTRQRIRMGETRLY